MSESEQEIETGQDLEEAIEQAAESVTIQASQLGELTGETMAGDALGLDNLIDVPVKVTVQVGRTQMTLGELINLAPGSLVRLDREAHEPADILVNGKVVAMGEVVTIGEMYGVRITSVESI